MSTDTNETRQVRHVHLRLDVEAATDEDAHDKVMGLVRAALDEEEIKALDRPADAPRVRSWSTEEALPEAWAPFVETGIPERVAEMFPPEPRSTDYRTPAGQLDVEAYEDAADTWRLECLTLADYAANLPSLVERLSRAEHARDGILDVLQRYPVPTISALDEQTERGRAATLWIDELHNGTAAARESALRTVVENAGDRTGYLPEAFHGTWLPADLIAVTTLRDLNEHHSRLMQRLLGPEQRGQLEQMLHEADPDVRIADPEDPGAPELYEGPASEAHAWIPPGVYQATGTNGQGEIRVVVGPSAVGNQQSASAAFPPAEHDAAVVNRIAGLLEDAEGTDPDRVLARIDTLVADTGRTTGRSATLIERGALFSDLLARREELLEPDDKGPEPPQQPGPDGLTR